MLDFQNVRLEDKNLIKKYLYINRFRNSEYNFTTIMAWQFVYQTQYAIANDCLLLKSTAEDGTTYFYFPLGHIQNIEAAILSLKAHCKAVGLPMILMNVSQEMFAILEALNMRQIFKETEIRDLADYVYMREKLITLSGKKLHGKRNHLNFFNANYEARLEPITEANQHLCEKMLRNEIQERSTRPYEELNATFMALRYRDEFGLSSGALFVEDTIIGVILGECHYDVSVIQVAKANVSYRGASVALFQRFLSEHLENCQFVNFMEDMGSEGLRKAKLSYSPDHLVNKSILHLKPI